MYAIYLQRWYTVAFALSVVILLTSFAPTRRSYWGGVLAFTGLAIGSVVAALTPFVFSILMASAFKPHTLTLFAYILPILVLVIAALPALALYPFIRPATARRVAMICFGIPTAIAALWTLFDAFRPLSMQSQSGPFAGFLCLLFLLLWMRVYHTRIVTTASQTTAD
jgi:hypothetical protein